MDLSSLLNDAPQRKSARPLKRSQDASEKNSLVELSTTVQYLLTTASKRTKVSKTGSDDTISFGAEQPSVSQSSEETSTVDEISRATCPRLEPSIKDADPSIWQPKLSLKQVTNDSPQTLPSGRSRQDTQPADMIVQLHTCEISHRGGEPRLLLEDMYEIKGAYPRGFFVVMAKRAIQHSFVFQYPDHPWFDDLYGMRKSAYTVGRTEDGELYEIHLKPSRDKKWLFGYLCKHSEMIRIVRGSMEELIYQRRLPLVLDLDDTMVRLVGDGDERFVPEKDVHKYGNRVAMLGDGKRVVLTERAHDFLEWAQQYFDISVCSLGDQSYVDNVVNVLDPQRTRIRGILYSARSEHDYIKRSPYPGRPPKDLLALYSFCALKNNTLGSSYSLPLILDDETRMWPGEQHDNIIVVKAQCNTDVWTVPLFPVVRDTLAHVHQEFFRQLDSWHAKQAEAEQNGVPCTREPPSAITIYKVYLRNILRDMIAKDVLPSSIS